MVSADRLQNRLKYWKTQLIDTSKRNRLLYFKATPTSTIKLTEPSLQDIYKRLVDRQQPFQFYPLEPGENLLEFDEDHEREVVEFSLPPLRSDEVRSNLTDKRLWRTLYSLRQKSRTSLQEQGIVTLFLAIGFLEWTESSSSSTPVRSPLILVPVELTQESSKDNYHVRLFEDEIALNPTLVHVLATNHGISLPELPDVDALQLDTYLGDVRQAVNGSSKWSVVPEVYMGLFSFHKLSMYKDLDGHSNRALDHPIVRALAGDDSRLPHTPDGLPTSEDLDRVVTPLETFQILDADSSQQEAIQAAKRGVSFILQGPPGTGKSQTISNIIAEKLADGKRVLFVSEKMAALEVVYRRLTDRGLGEFCLQAHSHKANKKEVIQQLGQALEPARRPPAQNEPDFSEFLLLKERLNAYVGALHKVRHPLDRSAYQVYGDLSRLLSAPDMHFDFESVETVTLGNLTHINEILSELSRVHDVIVDYFEHPWFGVQITQYNPHQTKADIRSHFGPLVHLLSETEEMAGALSASCGVAKPSTLSETDRLIVLAELVKQTPRPPATWFLPDAPTPLIDAAKRHQVRFDDYHQRRNSLMETYEPTVFLLPHSELILRLTEQHKPLLDRVIHDANSAQDTLVCQREALQVSLANISQSLDRLGKSLPAMAASCGVDAPTTLAGITQLCKVGEWISRDPKPLADWFSRTRLLELKAQAEEAQLCYSAYCEERDQIRGRYTDAFLSLDIPGLYSRFTGSYSGVFRILNPGYYRDLKQLRAEHRVSNKLSYDDAIRDLRIAKQALEHKQWIDAQTKTHIHAFGQHYHGLDTQWQIVLESVETIRQMVDSMGESRIPPGLQELLVASGTTIESVREQLTVVQAEVTHLEHEFTGLQRTLSLQGLPFTNKPLRDADVGTLKTWIEEIATSLSDYLVAWETVRSSRHKKHVNGDHSIADLVVDMQEAQSLVQIKTDVHNHAKQLFAEFGHLFTGMETRWDVVLAALDWTGQILEWFGETPPSTFIAVASGEQSSVEQLSASLASLSTLRQRIDEELVFLHSLFSAYLRIDSKAFTEAPISSARAWIQLRLDRLTDLDRWMNFQNVRGVCQREGLATFLSALCRDKPAANQFKPAFYKRFWALWLDKLYQTDTILAGFDGRRHEEYITRFRQLDRGQLAVAQSRLRSRLWHDRPTVGNGGTPTGEMSKLLREKAKKSRHKPLRKLFQDIPNLLLALKPCLLMSPLSVATFLDPNVVEFDTVIFDEASQICSEDAVGAIMRGKQLIVVGDSKQLPPSRFFATGTVEDYETEDEEEEAATEVYESILDECSTIGLQQWMLRWHYRSRCEDLIAFSNHHFYENKLVTFPGPFVPNMPAVERCVEFVSVPNGVYVRGKGQNAGTNRIEARKVATLVFQHFQSRPDRSLGVIAFSERQQTAIDDELRHLRSQRPEYEPFFSDDGEEPFFLKNLENVQGDERDTIIFSVGYGRDQHGKLTMNFGPLNKEGGERRLNVAVTRAKHQVKLVCSIQPHDIDLSRTEKKGPALLKYYMEFAQRGPSALAREIQLTFEPEFDSPFEEEVCKSLEEQGLKVHRQIGCAGYRIDLAVVNTEHPGKYLLGIECDGATYHSSKTARDRDRLRQQVLEEMGWRGRILRIWSSDWIQNREGQIARVMQALEVARCVTDDDLTTEETVIESFDIVVPISTNLKVEDKDTKGHEHHSISLDADTNADRNLPEGVIYYQSYRGENLGTPDDFYYLADYGPELIVDILVAVVEQEGPIHIQEATRRVITCWSMGKVGARLLQTVWIASLRAQELGSIMIRGDFLWPSNMSQAIVRVPSDESTVRSIEYIPLQEIAEACMLCIRTSYAIQKDELILNTARLLGYLRTGVNVRDRIDKAITHALDEGKFELKEGTVRLSRD